MTEMACARQKAEGSQDQHHVNKGAWSAGKRFPCSGPLLVIPEVSDADDACFKIVGPSGSLEMYDQNTKYCKQSLMLTLPPGYRHPPQMEMLGVKFLSGRRVYVRANTQYFRVLNTLAA